MRDGPGWVRSSRPRWRPRRALRILALASVLAVTPLAAAKLALAVTHDESVPYWNVFNIEDESTQTAVLVTYATLDDMLNDQNRTGSFLPNGFGAGQNIVGAGSDGTTYWLVFNIEDESTQTAVLVTYATLDDMLNDQNRTGSFLPSGLGAGQNIVGAGSDGTTYWLVFNIEDESTQTAVLVTYATLDDMLNDQNRTGSFTPDATGASGQNVVGAGSDGTTYWLVFNIEDESTQTAVLVTYSTLDDMLNDQNRTGSFLPNGFAAGQNIVGGGAFAPTEADDLEPDPTEEPTQDPTEEPTQDPTEEPTQDPTEEPATAPAGVVRLDGATRFATAAVVALDRFDPDQVDVVYLATGANFPDALAGGPLAADRDAPILLTGPDHLPDETADALKTLAPSQVVALGGAAVLADQVLTDAADAAGGADMDRIFGPDRFATAAAIADTLGPSDTVFLATGLNFPDALTGSAATMGAPILLATPTSLPNATRQSLATRRPDRIVALGGDVALSEQVLADAAAAAGGAATGRAFGPDRFATAVDVAGTFDDPDTVYVATGLNFPDALAGGPAAVTEHAPIVLVTTDTVPEVVQTYLSGLPDLRRIVILGGTVAISDDVQATLQDILDP